ncbi:unnamed protein product [Ilex paraguariensis]|uniref:Uncharacterized protein n=1 Tax=Ilex paraguariensis TaxID=185542 RepID=A0ABC8SYI2_9AQUA
MLIEEGDVRSSVGTQGNGLIGADTDDYEVVGMMEIEGGIRERVLGAGVEAEMGTPLGAAVIYAFQGERPNIRRRGPGDPDASVGPLGQLRNEMGVDLSTIGQQACGGGRVKAAGHAGIAGRAARRACMVGATLGKQGGRCALPRASHGLGSGASTEGRLGVSMHVDGASHGGCLGATTGSASMALKEKALAPTVVAIRMGGINCGGKLRRALSIANGGFAGRAVGRTGVVMATLGKQGGGCTLSKADHDLDNKANTDGESHCRCPGIAARSVSMELEEEARVPAATVVHVGDIDNGGQLG